MHYYKRNIGDYHKKAGRLSMIEHGAYTLLIDACYDREIFPTLDQAIDWCWARSAEEAAAVEFVLSKFFTLDNGVYTQPRINEDLDKYHKNSMTNKRIAKAREEKRRADRAGISTNEHEACTNEHEAPPNQEPLTINQEPIKDIAPGSDKPKSKRFVPPSIEQVKAYCLERGNQVDPENFIDHYEANGWMRGKNKIKSWQACVRTWEKNNNEAHRETPGKPSLTEKATAIRVAFEERERAREKQFGYGELVGEDGAPLQP